MHRVLLGLLLLALPASAGFAQAAPARHDCEAVSDANLPASLAGWTARSPLAAAANDAAASGAVLAIGKGADAQLKLSGEVTFPVAPGRAGGAESYGGLYELRITEAGDYQVSLGAGAWIEVVRDGAAVTSASHAHGPPCSSLRKTVVFPLRPGRYLVEISGAGEPVVAVMVTRAGK